MSSWFWQLRGTARTLSALHELTTEIRLRPVIAASCGHKWTVCGRWRSAPRAARAQARKAPCCPGRKRATAGLLQEYEPASEVLEHVGERPALLDDDGRALTVVEITDVRVRRFVDVPWEFAAAECEGDEDLAQWRAGHRRYWVAQGAPVDDDTEVICLSCVLNRRVGAG